MSAVVVVLIAFLLDVVVVVLVVVGAADVSCYSLDHVAVLTAGCCFCCIMLFPLLIFYSSDF